MNSSVSLPPARVPGCPQQDVPAYPERGGPRHTSAHRSADRLAISARVLRCPRIHDVLMDETGIAVRQRVGAYLVIRLFESGNASDCGSQKSPVNPSELKIWRISAACGRRESACNRVEYHSCASPHSWSIVTSGRMGWPILEHHSRACSSDRKNSMLLQVNTMSSHHLAAGTRQWNSQSEDSGPVSEIASSRGSIDCSQRECTVAGRFRAAGMPRASHAQLA